MKIVTLILFIIVNLNAYEIYEDSTNRLTIKDILSIKDKFIKRDSLNFGFKKSTIWVKLNLKNYQNRKIDKFVRVDVPFLNSVNYYEIDEKIKEKLNGTKISINERDFKSKNIIFQTTLKENEEKEVFLKVKSNSSIILFIYSYDSFLSLYENLKAEDTLTALLFGALITLLIYNFFIFLYSKDIAYLYYLLYVGFFLIYQLFYTSYIVEYMDVSKIYNYIFWGSISIFVIFLTLFTRTIFNTKNDFKIIDKLLIFEIFLWIVDFILIFIDEVSSAIFRNQILAPLSILIGVILGVLALKRGVKIAKFYLIGWITYLIFSLIPALMYIGLIREGLFAFHSTQIGFLIEAMLFSLMLAYKITLLKEEKIKVLNEIKQKDELLFAQSKLATIGETLCNIEHQWRTPLTKLTSILMEVEAYIYHKGVPSKEFLLDSIAKSNEVLIYMSKIVNDFRSFYRSDSKPIEFYIKNSILSAIKLIEFFTIKHNIKVDFKMDINPKINGYPNEFTQVILNILSNAKDVLIERKIKNPKIEIVVTQNKNIEIEIKDNGGGVENEAIDKIFKPFFSQKTIKSTGLGLYMSKIIIEKRMGGELKVINSKDKTIFKIILLCI